MFNNVSHTGIFVLDQDEGLDFYVGKVGLEVESDVDLGFMRWLTVRVPGTDFNILLERPGPPALSDEAAAQVRDLLTKGALGLAIILTTDDCRKTCEVLRGRGVEIAEEPTEQPYGLDCAIRDPFGNNIRITQPAGTMSEITDDIRDRWNPEN